MTAYKKSKLSVLLIIASIVFTLGTSWANSKEVVISEQSWTGSTVICQVMKYVLENKLNIPAKVVQLSGAATWVGMEKGDVDIFSEIWETAEVAGIEKFVKEKKAADIVLSYANAPQGWYIPKYVADQYGIKTVEDLKGKEKLFDIDGDGIGDIWGGPTSWKQNEITSDKVRDYGLHFTTLGVEQFAWLATLKSAFLKKQPVIFYYWEPEWLFTEYELVKIQEPAFEDAKWKFVQGHPEESKITCESQPTNVWVGVSKKLETRIPKAFAFFKNWSMPIGEVSRLIALVTDLPDKPKLTPEAAAKKWVESNPDIVNGWLKGIK